MFKLASDLNPAPGAMHDPCTKTKPACLATGGTGVLVTAITVPLSYYFRKTQNQSIEQKKAT